jgi:hypothetical protein
MINIGLAHLRRPEWILHIDADIALPGRFRHMLERAKLDRANIYGADRVNIYGWDRWQEIRAARRAHYSDRYFVSPPEGHPIGARIIHHEHGFCPIGYFQLWHASAGKRYPVGQGTAEHTDVLFAIQWSRQQRILLPEIFVYHLDSLAGPSPMGCNWGGRKTPIFGPAHHHQPGAPYTQKGC